MINKNQKWLVAGGTGQLGSAVSLKLKKMGINVSSISINKQWSESSGIESVKLDVLDDIALAKAVEALRPDVIVNCLAITTLEKVTDPEMLNNVNATFPERLATIAASKDLPFVHLSSDAVYNASSPNDRADESAIERPCNDYARSKLAGDQNVLESYSSALVLRANLYGWNPIAGVGLAEWLVGEFEKGRPVRGFADVYFSPVYTETLASLIIASVQANLRGLYNVACDQCLSKYAFAKLLVRKCNFDDALVERGLLADIGLQIDRPKNTCMTGVRLYDALNMEAPSLEDDMEQFASSSLRSQLKQLIG